MYLYGNKPVHAWNAVDVLNSDGSVQHGSVISAVEDGLIIDFDCPKQRSQFVEYGRIFDCSDDLEEHWTELDAEVCQVQALIRFSPDTPWVWLPAEFIECYSFADDTVCYAFVEVQRNGAAAKELLPYAQIRIRPSEQKLESRRIAQDHFLVRSCTLPENYWSRVTTMISIRFNQTVECELSVIPEAVLTNTLVYCQRSEDEPILQVQLETCFRHSKADVDEYAQNGTEPPWLQRHSRRRKPPQKQQNLPNELRVPPEILAEIFDYLDTIDRLRCRRTCATWNAVLTEVKFKDLVISVNEKSFASALSDYEWNPLYAVTGCFLKCLINKATERIVIKDLRATDRGEVLPLIERFLKVPTTRAKQLIFCDSEFATDFPSMVEMVNILYYYCCEIKGFCGSLVWKNCKFATEDMVVFVSCGSVNPNSENVQLDIWNELVKHMFSPDMEGVSEWIAESSVETKVEISEVLNHCQFWDPDAGTHPKYRRWFPDNLHTLDVGKLTKWTQCLLQQLRAKLPSC